VLGFKSFAERTTVEFGPGISAVVGPNGSGKSNLADALRWTLGEAGRSLRARRAEDVIFAGSSARRATGMADVTLVLENSDRLLPVDYGQVELGRRLFRSGENEYMLNRQRIRLRDLIDLLDEGNLADNAFLFIGQGMVDQALALRPEERRPLFEEAAGVRRHERRRRQAETELVEAEANLERLRDVLAELRPQARRLAAQAEQLQARRSAGHDLATALVAAARARWHELHAAAKLDQAALASAHAEADAALADLRTAEEEGQRLSRGLAERAEREAAQRALVEAQRARTVELRLSLARTRSDQQAAERERQRIADERKSLTTRSAAAEQELARPQSSVDEGLSVEVERLSAEIEQLRGGSGRAAGGSIVPASDLAALERRRASAGAQIAELRRQTADDDQQASQAEARRDEAIGALEAARQRFAGADEASQSSRSALDRAVAEESRLSRVAADAEAVLNGLRGRVASVERGLDAASHAALGRAVKARGGALAAEGMETDSALRHAVAAALGDAAQAWLTGGDTVASLPRDGGTVLLRGGSAAAGAVAEKQVALARSAGGGPLVEAIRRDPQGELTRLLSRTLWVPRLEDALRIRGQLAVGWQVVTIDGQLLTDQGVLRLAASDRFLALREERDEIGGQLPAAEQAAAQAGNELRAAAAARAMAATGVGAARSELDEARKVLSLAEEVARTTQRRLDNVLRDQALHRSRMAGLEAEAADIALRIAAAWDQRTRQPSDAEPRLEALLARRSELTARLAAQQAQERAASEAQRRAEITLAMTDERGRQLDTEQEALAGRLAQLSGDAATLQSDYDAAAERERELGQELELLVGDAGEQRRRLIVTEATAARARERLREAEGRSRAAEVAAMEALLKLETQREQLLVELAGIGQEAVAALAGPDAEDRPAETADALADDLARALDAAISRWGAETRPHDEPAPAAKLATLRRRFHDLGAGNPFAATEYAEARDRLETMETQARDLETAIGATRNLIGDLNELIASQFRATFTALEASFARRFKQLFDGGEAELALTAPDDLAATGIEITARPPGKKRQPLQMLSGGERALTAVALLLAMLEVRPVPFCVLDEVDAALDEANIARFAQALRTLADKTQFIVITHNRGTIEMADALYGVTIGPDAVSRIVSLRLPPATAADPAGNGHATADAVTATTAEVLA
jgi:chromosome segregation protein